MLTSTAKLINFTVLFLAYDNNENVDTQMRYIITKIQLEYMFCLTLTVICPLIYMYDFEV